MPGRVTPSAADAARAASGRAGVSPGAGSSRGGTTSGTSSADGFVPPRTARRGAGGGASTAPAPRLGRASASAPLPLGAGGCGGLVRRARPRTVAQSPDGSRRPTASRIRATSRAGSRKTSVDHTRRCRQPSRSSCSARSRSRSRVVRIAAYCGPSDSTASTSRPGARRVLDGEVDRVGGRPDVLVDDEPVAAQPPGQVGEHDRGTSRRRATRASRVRHGEPRASPTARSAGNAGQRAAGGVREEVAQHHGAAGARAGRGRGHPAAIDDTTVIDRRARVIATLRRRSPPSMLSGPKRCSTRPCGVLP